MKNILIIQKVLDPGRMKARCGIDDCQISAFEEITIQVVAGDWTFEKRFLLCGAHGKALSDAKAMG